VATLGEIMSAELVTVGPNATVAEAATVMGGHRVGSALVMTDDQMHGIFTERDIVRALSQDFDAPGQPVAHWMTHEVHTVSPSTSVQEALDLMLTNGFRHLPVVEGDKVVGIVSIRDLTRAATSG
jgi:CBS domain-containing protein